MNILILSAGRRVELIQSFRRAARRLDIESNIVSGDCSDTAPALYFSDRTYKLPRISEPNYLESIIQACDQENISLIIPTIDTDLLLLAKYRSFIENKTNAKVMISDTRVVEICRDKTKTHHFFESNVFGSPKMYSDEELLHAEIQFPLFIKPKSGSSSVDTFVVNNFEELNLFRSIIKEPIIQDFIEGDEYTVDVFLDFNSTIITVVPRLRLATRDGEISKGRIIKDREIIDDVKRMMELLKPIGHITIQLMKTKNGIKYIEINPRFGGGAPMSIQSGADSCENLYRIMLGEQLTYNEDYRDNITFLRYDSSICLDENMRLVK